MYPRFGGHCLCLKCITYCKIFKVRGWKLKHFLDHFEKFWLWKLQMNQFSSRLFIIFVEINIIFFSSGVKPKVFFVSRLTHEGCGWRRKKFRMLFCTKVNRWTPRLPTHEIVHSLGTTGCNGVKCAVWRLPLYYYDCFFLLAFRFFSFFGCV